MSDASMRVRVFMLGFVAASLVAFNPAGWAQVQHRQGQPPAPPRATTKPTAEWPPKSIAYIKASNTMADRQFGYSIALSGDGNTLAVGSVNEDSAAKGINGNQADHTAVNAGAVYVYTRTPAGWKQQAYVKASNTAKGYQFGNSLALSGDGNILAVGSAGEASSARGINGDQSDKSMGGAGAVYVFSRTGSMWAQQAYVKASNTNGPNVGNQFGYSVALSTDGRTLAVGSTSEPSAATGVNGNQTDKSIPDSGAVYVFTRGDVQWSQQAYVKPWNTVTRGVLFGYSVGLSGNGDTLAVGTYDEDGGKGAVYVFTRAAGNWSQQTRLTATNAERGDSLGCSVAISDDGNTILAGAFDEDAILAGIQPPDAGANDEADDASAGAAYVFVRAGTKWSQQAYVKAFNTRINDQFAWALAMSRDGNTIAIGSHLEDSGAKGINGDQNDYSAEDSGAVYVYTRTGTSWNPAAYVKASNTTPASEFGIAVALNGDGKVLAVGATREDSGAKGVNGNQKDKSAANSGAAYVYY